MPWWESPDICVAPGTSADAAPQVPSTRSGIARAGQPNTLWAHVWNLGRAPVYNARVEFYWCDPSLGISATSAHLIGAAHVDLGARDSGRAHTIVKCPTTWYPVYVNGGHECLVVRYFEPLTDPIIATSWTPDRDRHVGQRNITVINAASPATLTLTLRLGCSRGPGRVRLAVERVPLVSVPWLALQAGRSDHGIADARRAKETVGLLPPVTVEELGASSAPEPDPRRLRQTLDVDRDCDELATTLLLSVDGLRADEAAAYRVTQLDERGAVGGYTVLALGPRRSMTQASKPEEATHG